MSNRRRPHRQVAVLILAASLVAATFASPAFAALANIDIGGGVTPGIAPAGHNSGATPPQVSPGKVAGFHLWVKNRDAANLNTFFMKAVTSATFVGAYWSRNGGDPVACIPADGALCSFGALNSGDELNITAAFTLPPGTTAVEDNCLKPNEGGVGHTGTSWVCVDFQFASESGFVLPKPKKGNNSRGDLYHWHDSVATDVGPDKGATFPFCDLQGNPTCAGSVLSVSNNAATRNNVQSTKVTAPNVEDVFNTAYGKTGLAVADNLGPDFDCEDSGNLPTCTSHQTTGNDAFVGQWSLIDVNSDLNLDPAYIIVVLSMYGVNPNSIDGVVHAWFDATDEIWKERTVNDPCDTVAGPGPEQDECFWVAGSGQVTTVTIWMHNNGRARTF
jgi:hypothetical protein